MVKYRVDVSVRTASGVGHASETRVAWSCTRLPATHVGGAEVHTANPEAAHGELRGAYEAVKDAEARGETPVRDEIEVSIARETRFKRGTSVDVQRSTSVPRPVAHAIFEAIRARPRPLADADSL